MKLINDIVITHDEFLQVKYSLSPINSNNLKLNINLQNTQNVDNFKLENYFSTSSIFTLNGREAIHIALETYNLSKNDVVTIITTTNNLYISSCVTNEINKFCKWSRNFEPNTKIIFVNHEFGFPIEKLSYLKNYNLPIIEDCAYSFLSQNEENSVGTIGDYVIYSLPKIFPMQFGGILKSNKYKLTQKNSCLDKNEILYLEKLFSYYSNYTFDIIKKRQENFLYYAKKIKELNHTSRFKLEDRYCPGVFMLKINNFDLSLLKTFMNSHGIESSVFYGENCFFLPNHQFLEKSDIDYILTILMLFKIETVELSNY